MLSKYKYTLTEKNIFGEYRKLEIGEIIINGDCWKYFEGENISLVSGDWIGSKIQETWNILESGMFLRKIGS